MRALTLFDLVVVQLSRFRSSNEVLAREGIDTMSNDTQFPPDGVSSNEVLAREGIDTFSAVFLSTRTSLGSNEVLAREGIDTIFLLPPC